ncbi:MAG: hypothetical protein JSR99_06040 [Proteobacteria bacterium]|nr:hypothetical protein [Pseudomonadota bacterium]
MVTDTEILDGALQIGLRDLVRANRDMGLSTYEEQGAFYVVRGKSVICQISPHYKGFFARIFEWWRIPDEFRLRGLSVNVDDTSKHARFVKRNPKCVGDVERVVDNCLAAYRKAKFEKEEEV